MAFYQRILGLVFVTLALAACKTSGHKDADAASAESSSDLTWEEAKSRKARVSNVVYKVDVDLSADGPTFTGKSEIRFDLTDNAKPLRVDFFEGKVSTMKVNGHDLPLSAKKMYWIELPTNLLGAGPNVVEIAYTQSYSTQGQGLHKFTDPKTKEIFLHTQFQTFDANRFMPAFDQPDLRAPLSLSVTAPANWEVITATMETSKVKTGATRRWIFPATPSIATYLYSLHAGPYKVWKDRYEDIPLRLFARPSMAKHVKVKEWFTYTKQGLKFFNAYFDYKYPFKKYDQLAVPEFNAGAMENVASVTFNENYLWRSEPTRQQLRGLAEVILHEMAHMWFGDIVTMTWWNDLWLNESFATFLATLALHEATTFKEAWQGFFAAEKNWAYWEDALITTHPIEREVPSVKVAFASFDGITYGKGAAVLKQLNAHITPEAFKKGIQAYIKTHAYQNAELKDFIAALQTQTKRDLTHWSTRWLRQSGTDKIATRWSCTGDQLAQIDVVVTPSKGSEFRPQTVKMAMFTDKEPTRPKVVSVDLTQAEQTVKGPWACPAFVYPNYQDDGYIAVSLDAKSMDWARRNLSRIDDKLLRTMVWDDLWEMVRNTEMPLKDYIQIVNVHFPKENDPIILGQIVATISGKWSEFATVLHYWPETDERLKKERAQFAAGIEREYLRRFQAAKPGSDDQRLWFDNFVSLARTPKALDQLVKWMDGREAAKGMPVDLDRQWNIVRALSRYQHPQAAELMAQMRIKDSSDRGERNALSSEAIQPDMKVKEKWVNILKAPKPSVSFAQARSVMWVLFPVEQRGLAKRFEKDFYEYLKTNGKSENELFVEGVAASMAPLACSAGEAAQLRKFIKDESKFSPSVSKALKMSLDEDERCQRIRAFSSI